jgi:hypothetical protein
MGLTDSPFFRRCEAEEETSAHALCECEALATLRHAYMGSFFLDPEDVRGLSLGAIWNFIKGAGLSLLGLKFKGHTGPAKAYVHLDSKGSAYYLFCSLSILRTASNQASPSF